MSYVTWNDALDIHCIPYAYMCEICKQRIMEKQCKAIRITEPKATNYFFHDRHEAIQYADWLHKINNEIKYGQSKTIQE